jgi:hypothetical protein
MSRISESASRAQLRHHDLQDVVITPVLLVKRRGQAKKIPAVHIPELPPLGLNPDSCPLYIIATENNEYNIFPIPYFIYRQRKNAKLQFIML